MRATVERFPDADEFPDIKVIIADGDNNEDVAIKISDEGGGIKRSDMPRIFSYLFTTARNRSGMSDDEFDYADFSRESPLAGLGYGLPISRCVLGDRGRERRERERGRERKREGDSRTQAHHLLSHQMNRRRFSQRIRALLRR